MSGLGERGTRSNAGGIAIAAVGAAVVLAGQYDLTTIAAGNAVGSLVVGSGVHLVSRNRTDDGRQQQNGHNQ